MNLRALCELAVFCCLCPLLAGAQEDLRALLVANGGGALTASVTSSTIDEAAIGDAARQQRRRGEAFFNTAFVAAPSAAVLRDGLGPLFNAAACDNCHGRQGRREFASEGEPLPVTQVLQLSQRDVNGNWRAHRSYGENLNPAATGGVPAEGWASVSWEAEAGEYGDKTPWVRYRPRLSLHELAYGALLGEDVVWSLRTAQPLFGMGLLESVDEAEILAFADPDDSDGDGISGRVNRIGDSASPMIGRFGWKANHASLRNQISSALINEQGVTSSDHPRQNCAPAQSQCVNAVDGGRPEIADPDLAAIVQFVRLLPVPVRRNLQDRRVAEGAALFVEAACDRCHRPEMTTASGGLAPLSVQVIYPFTDLLLHDMGEGLADQRPDQGASGSEWRTAALWGLGQAELQGSPPCYLHDCRARSLAEAILWHGGEASPSANHFLSLSQIQREAILAFLRSL
ncbi:MAG: di-heme oxidoredictase family protein [Parahaliea sp.]